MPDAPQFIDNPLAPDVFADAASGWFRFGGVLRITFEAARASHSSPPGPPNRVVIGRLVMPEQAAVDMARMILAAVESRDGDAGRMN